MSEKQHWNLGRTTSEETKQKIREANSGQTLTPEQRQKWEEAQERYRNSSEYVPPMLGKQLSKEARAKIGERSKASQAHKTIARIQRVTEHLSQFDISLISTDTKYHLKCEICNTYFSRTKSVLNPSKYDHYNGEYCPTCFPEMTGGYWTRSGFEKYAELKDTPGRLYFIRAFNENEEFYKIGITIQSVQKRYKSFEYSYEILFDEPMTIFEAFQKEQELKRQYKQYRYWPKLEIGGRTECFSINISTISL